MKQRIVLTVILLAMSFGITMTTNAQSKGVNWRRMVESAKRGEINIDRGMAGRVRAAHAEGADMRNPAASRLTGTWYVTVPGATPDQNFYAYQTFGSDGTFVETSSLLITLTEGPAHGVWEPRRNGAALTFELFAFDPATSTQVGRIRVRCVIRLTDADHITADTVVDFIEPNGNVIPEIATGPFTGERVKVRPL
ncbi:MAG: hypothetical protein K1X72_11920 [Pyrinomonadaceae bacterium]|nr:hypothetical protein [Pyrinomonadaceae bacterium]